MRDPQAVGTGPVDRPGVTSQFVHVRGAELGYETSGSGPDLVWCHGLTSSRESEDKAQLLDWTKVPARIVRYDARGHGVSTSTSEVIDYSWEALAVDQLVLADHLAISSYIAGGASMGCGTALHAALLAPERVKGLILAIPPTAWETRAGQAGQWNTAADIVETVGVEPIIAASAEVAPPDPYSDDPGYRPHREANLRAWDTARLAQVFRGATQADLPSRSAISAISVPTLILAWSGDPTHPESTAHALKDLIPHASLHVASNANDLARWTERVATFLAQ